MRESHGIAKRVDLPLALAHLCPDLRLVVLAPGTCFRAEVERICVRVDQDAARLAVDNAGDHFFELLIFPRERKVRHDLRG